MGTMEPLISVIIPVYNMELYLPRCMDSILANTYKNLEILCVDDGSKDGSLSILQSYAEQDARIVVIAKENGGVSSARNAGLDRMTGAYFTFIDPDDFVHPQFFELLLRALEESHTDVAFCGIQNVEDKDLPLQTEALQLSFSQLQRVTVAQIFKSHALRSFGCGKLYCADHLKTLRFRENLSYSEDSVFFAEYAEQVPDMCGIVIRQGLYYYYQHTGSLIRQAKLPMRLEVATIYVDKTLAARQNDVIFLDQAIKRCLSIRYLAAYILPYQEIVRQCNRHLKSCLPLNRETAIFSRKKKLVNSLFIRIPRAYWLYRSVKEPDMRRWEIVERKKRRAAKRNAEVGK